MSSKFQKNHNTTCAACDPALLRRSRLAGSYASCLLYILCSRFNDINELVEGEELGSDQRF